MVLSDHNSHHDHDDVEYGDVYGDSEEVNDKDGCPRGGSCGCRRRRK